MARFTTDSNRHALDALRESCAAHFSRAAPDATPEAGRAFYGAREAARARIEASRVEMTWHIRFGSGWRAEQPTVTVMRRARIEAAVCAGCGCVAATPHEAHDAALAAAERERVVVAAAKAQAQQGGGGMAETRTSANPLLGRRVRLEVFGSSANGFGATSSDLDIGLVVVGGLERAEVSHDSEAQTERGSLHHEEGTAMTCFASSRWIRHGSSVPHTDRVSSPHHSRRDCRARSRAEAPAAVAVVGAALKQASRLKHEPAPSGGGEREPLFLEVGASVMAVVWLAHTELLVSLS